MSNTLFENNIKSLKKYHLEIAEAIEKYEVNNSIEVGVSEVEDKRVLYIVKNEKTYQLDSLYNSEAILNMWYEHMTNEFRSKTLILFGIGNGMYIKKFIDECQSEYSIYILEPDLDILYTAFSFFDYTEIFDNEKVHIFVKSLEERDFSWKSLLLKNIEYSDLKTILWSEYINYDILYPETEPLFMESMQSLVNYTSASRLVSERFGEAYFNNTVNNIDKVVNSKSLYSLYKMLPKGIPAIIVSSGPSLSKNINMLKEAKGKALIISADSAIPALLGAGIMPDMYVSVDGVKHFKHFVDERVKDIPAVLCPFSSPAAVKDNQIQFFIQDECDYINEYMVSNDIQYPLLQSGGSVANMCAALAILLDIKTIILVGQDLAYTGGKTHAAGTVRADHQIDQETLTYVKDIYGNMIESSNEFILYKESFEDTIRCNPSTKFIDATEGGAYIEGTEIMTLKDTINKCCKDSTDLYSIFDKCDDILDSVKKEDFKKYWLEIRKHMDDIMSACKTTIDNYDRMYLLTKQGKYASSEMKRLQNKNNELSEKIDNNKAISFIEYLNQDAVHEVLDNVYSQENDVKAEIMEAIRIGKSYTENVLAKAEIVKNAIK